MTEKNTPPAGWVGMEHAPRDGSVFLVQHKTHGTPYSKETPSYLWPRPAAFNYGCEGRCYLVGVDGEEGGSTLPQEEWGDWLCLILPPFPQGVA